MNATSAVTLHPAIMESLTESVAIMDARITSTQQNSTNDLNYTGRIPSNLTIFDNNTTSQGNMNNTHGGASLCEQILSALVFTDTQLARVLLTWLLFIISSVGNIFVLSCVYKKASSSHVHMIMMHLTLADLAFTFLVMPNDAIWNTTMEWKGGNALCKVCQMCKQMGMYISSFMVVVIALDRCCSILQPMSTLPRQRMRTKYMVIFAWTVSILSAIPAAVFFSVKEAKPCPDHDPFYQCVDYDVVQNRSDRRPYYFFTMFMSFILPMIVTVVSYSLVVYEITNMMRRDRVMMGRRSSNIVNITRARRKTMFMTSLVTLTFVILWGPYYGIGIAYWINENNVVSKEVMMIFFVTMYVHPAIHPMLYGVFMKDVRVKFGQLVSQCERTVTCNQTDENCKNHILRCLDPERRSNGRRNIPTTSRQEGVETLYNGVAATHNHCDQQDTLNRRFMNFRHHIIDDETANLITVNPESPDLDSSASVNRSTSSDYLFNHSGKNNNNDKELNLKPEDFLKMKTTDL